MFPNFDDMFSTLGALLGVCCYGYVVLSPNLGGNKQQESRLLLFAVANIALAFLAGRYYDITGFVATLVVPPALLGLGILIRDALPDNTIRVRLRDGTTGKIHRDKFDPSTMEKL